MGVLTAATLILSYIERLIPLNFGVYGIKAGFANIGVLIALYSFGAGTAAAVSLVRVVIAGLLFNGVSSMLYSAAGAVFALLAMLPLSKSGGQNSRFGTVGVSVAGAIAHIIGQLFVASLLLGAPVWVYSPLMITSAVATGAINGMVSGLVLRYLKNRRT